MSNDTTNTAAREPMPLADAVAIAGNPIALYRGTFGPGANTAQVRAVERLLQAVRDVAMVANTAAQTFVEGVHVERGDSPADTYADGATTTLGLITEALVEALNGPQR